LENIISEPQIIAITGVQNLNPETGNNWKDGITTHLFEACIPYFWTIQIVPDELLCNRTFCLKKLFFCLLSNKQNSSYKR
jgi:hypothetical protein